MIVSFFLTGLRLAKLAVRPPSVDVSMTTAFRYDRLSLLRKLGLFLLFALVLFASLLIYIQTRHGFRHVVVPLAATLTGARLEVRDGVLSLLGTLEVDGLAYKHPASGSSFDAGRVAIRIAPWSLIVEGVPRIDELELKQANIRIVQRPGAAGEPAQKPDTESAWTLPKVSVAIERARFEDVNVIVDQGTRRISGRGAATVDRLGPGRAGTITLRTDFLLESHETPDLLGTIDLTLSFDVGSGGTPIAWSGPNRALVRFSRGSLDPADPEVVHFEQMLTGGYDHTAQNLRLASTLAIHRAGAQLGTAELTAVVDGMKHPAVTDASLTMANITGDALNLWLDNHGDARLYEGRFDARLETQVEGPKTSVRGSATGSAVRLRLGDREVSPPVDISLQHGGSFDSMTRAVTIDRLSLTLGDKVKTLLSGSLNHPVSLHLDQSEGKTSSAVTGGDQAVWSLRLAPSEIQELRPWLALLGRDPLKEVEAGRLGGALVVSMREEGAIVEVTGRLEGTDIMLRREGSGQAGLTGPSKIVADWKSRLTGLQRIKVDPLTVSIILKGKQVAALRATGDWRFGDAMGLAALDGTLTLKGLRGGTLNPLLGLWSQARIGQGEINGHADVAVDESRARWDVDVSGQDILLRLPGTRSDAPPLGLLIKQAGEFDRKTRTLRLNQLDVQVIERSRSVATLSFDQPLTLNLAQGKDGDNPKTGKFSEAMMLGLRVNHLAVHQLRPWVALAGSQALALIRDGVLDADLKVRFSGADDVAVVGRLDVDELTFERGGKTAAAPVTVSTEIRASVVGRSHAAVESWAVRVLDRDRVLAQARLAGSADSAGATDLTLNVTAGNLSECADRLGLLTPRQQMLISGGNLTGDVQLVTAGPAKPLTVKAGLRSADLNLRLDSSHQLTRTIGLQADVEMDASRTLVDLRHVEIAVESGGSQVGTFMARGRWPLTTGGSGASAGAVSVTVKEWDSGPFVDFFGLLPGRRSGPLPVTGELTVTQEADGMAFSLKGKETIGPVTVAGKGGDPEPATVHLEHDVTRRGDTISVAMLALTAERPKGRADRVTMTGKISTGNRPRVELRGSLDALDTDWYAAMASSPSDHGSTGTPSDTPQDPKEEGSGMALPLDLDVDLAIGSVIYRTLEIGKGRFVAKGDGESMRATLEPTGLTGGSVQGTVTIAVKGGQQEYGWNAKGDALDLGILTKAAFAEPEPRVTGLGKFTTSGTGLGWSEAFRQSLAGTMVFDVADGRFVKAPVMEFLAEQTHIEEFKKLGFKTLQGEFQLKAGWVHLNQVRAHGPGIAVEAGGKIGLDGRLDAQVLPKIGPALSSRMNMPCLDQFAKTADGFMVLPFAVTVQGTAENPAYGVQVTSGSMVGQQGKGLVGKIANLLTGCRSDGAAAKMTEDAIGAGKDKTKDFLKGLLGEKKKP